MANANPPQHRKQQPGAYASRPRSFLRNEPKPIEPPAPWRTHRDDFLAVERTPEVTAREEQFEKQAKLLSEIITPIEYKKTISHFVDLKEHRAAGKTVFGDYINTFHLNFLKEQDPYNRFYEEERLIGPFFELVGFQVEEDNRAFIRKTASLDYLPFQGTGGFGLAIVASDIKASEKKVTLSKIALSKFLDVAPPDLEYIVIVRASKFDFKRLAEVEEAGIPIVFDLSGRTQSPKRVIDPLEGCLEKDDMRSRIMFLGQLSEDQAKKFGEMSDAQKTSEMILSLANTASERPSVRGWPAEMISILSFGHEEFTPEEESEKTRGTVSKRPSLSQNTRDERHWQQDYAVFPPECLPANEASEAIQRMQDVGCIWSKVLRDNGLTFAGPVGRLSAGNFEMPVFDKEKIQEIGRFLGIDAMVDSLYEGVPLDYII